MEGTLIIQFRSNSDLIQELLEAEAITCREAKKLLRVWVAKVHKT